MGHSFRLDWLINIGLIIRVQKRIEVLVNDQAWMDRGQSSLTKQLKGNCRLNEKLIVFSAEIVTDCPLGGIHALVQ